MRKDIETREIEDTELDGVAGGLVGELAGTALGTVEGIAAPLRVGQGRVGIVSGVDPDALVVVEGGLEPLLTVAAGSIVRQLVP